MIKFINDNLYDEGRLLPYTITNILIERYDTIYKMGWSTNKMFET